MPAQFAPGGDPIVEFLPRHLGKFMGGPAGGMVSKRNAKGGNENKAGLPSSWSLCAKGWMTVSQYAHARGGPAPGS